MQDLRPRYYVRLLPGDGGDAAVEAAKALSRYEIALVQTMPREDGSIVLLSLIHI